MTLAGSCHRAGGPDWVDRGHLTPPEGRRRLERAASSRRRAGWSLPVESDAQERLRPTCETDRRGEYGIERWVLGGRLGVVVRL